MNLNEKQLEAIHQTEGPMLLLASAGSGKTTTLTKRYEYLLNKGVSHENILMVTFTRKAANEMKERIKRILPSLNLDKTWVETFHRICMRILHKEGHLLGISQDFSICSNYNSKKIIQDIIYRHHLSGGSDKEESEVTKGKMFDYIGALKTLLISSESLTNNQPSLTCVDWEQANLFIESIKTKTPNIYEALLIVYPEYQMELKRKKMLDFEDLIMSCVELFDKNESVLKNYQDKFSYIQVDEFQDTNYMQYMLLQQLSRKSHNICVCGDDFQSIYGFRGGDIRNILGFERDFPTALTIKLEQNYRSTKNIVEFSNEVIKHNKNQKDKTLFTENIRGEKVEVVSVMNEHEEATFIVQAIEKLKKDMNYRDSDFAVLYRNNHQSNLIAKLLHEHNISFQITGDMAFMEREEIKDIFAYLKLIENPLDTFSFRRIINKPKRGIGVKTVNYVFDNLDGSVYDFLIANENNKSIIPKGREGIKEIIEVLNKCSNLLQSNGIGPTIEQLLNDIDYEERVHGKSFPWVRQDVSENLNEIVRFAYEIEKEKGRLTVDEFQDALENIFVSSKKTLNKANLMTIHKSKGLEFPVVFVTGLNNATLPNEDRMDSLSELEEERRVFYVAITRAKELLYLIHPNNKEKRIEGVFQTVEVSPSMFLEETKDSNFITTGEFED